MTETGTTGRAVAQRRNRAQGALTKGYAWRFRVSRYRFFITE